MDKPKTTKQEMLELMDFEIKRIEAYQNRAGWNTWLLLGTLVTITGILFTKFENTVPNYNMLITFVGFALAYEWIKSIISQLSKHQKSQPSRLVSFSNQFSPNRVSYVYIAIYSSLLVFLSILLKEELPFYLFILATYSFYGISGLLLLFFSFKDQYFIPDQSNSLGKSINFVFFVFSPIEIYLIITQSYQAIDFGNLRIGFLLITLHAILVILTERHIKTNLLEKLEILRRTLSLGIHSPEMVQKSLEEALIGISPLTRAKIFMNDLKIAMQMDNIKQARKTLNQMLNFLGRTPALQHKPEKDFIALLIDTKKETEQFLARVPSGQNYFILKHLLSKLNTYIEGVSP